MFSHSRTVQQVAALPYVQIDDRFEVLLITSRPGGRWLLPKGWPSNGRSMAEAARREAEEEAGVLGVMHDTSIGTYTDNKKMRQGYEVPCTVFVYPLQVLQHSLSWKEKPQRRQRWCGLPEAAERAGAVDLARLLAGLAQNSGDDLRTAAAEISALAAP